MVQLVKMRDCKCMNFVSKVDWPLAKSVLHEKIREILLNTNLENMENVISGQLHEEKDKSQRHIKLTINNKKTYIAPQAEENEWKKSWVFFSIVNS